MKNTIATIAITCCFIFSVQAQKTATWKGGTPGRNTDWSCATNWKEGRVPDEFSDVVIPDVSQNGHFQPVIRNEVEPVRSLIIMSGATLNIELKGSLDVSEPLEAMAGAAIINHGRLNATLQDSPDSGLPAIASNR